MAFNFGSTTATTTTVHGSAPTSVNTFVPGATVLAPTLTIPSYDEVFPNRSDSEKVGLLLRRVSAASDEQDAHLAGQELVDMMSNVGLGGQLQNTSTAQRLLLLPQDPTLQPVPADTGLRNRLLQNPTVLLWVTQSDGTKQQEGTLSPNMLQDICSIADDLQISEQAAICLYHKAYATGNVPHSSFVQKCLVGSKVKSECSVAWSAREIFFAQRPLALRTSLSLLQHRMEERTISSESACRATDSLLQAGWIENLVQLIRIYTNHIDLIMTSFSNSGTTETASQFWQKDVKLQSYYEERQMAAECLFFAAYHVQLTTDEVGSLIDLVMELTERSVVFDPLFDVPDPYVASPEAAMGELESSWFFQSNRKEKNPLSWQRELVTSCWTTGQPRLMRCYCTIVMSIVSALATRTVLMSRHTHTSNEFGMVSSHLLSQPR